MNIEFSKEAVKAISKQDKNTKRRIRAAIEKLPFGDVKKLQGYSNDYRLRVGDLRVLYSVNGETIIIKNVIPRGQAYKRL